MATAKSRAAQFLGKLKRKSQAMQDEYIVNQRNLPDPAMAHEILCANSELLGWVEDTFRRVFNCKE